MTQSDGKNNLKRFQFRIDGTTKAYSFRLNPTEYTFTRPQRSTVTKTQNAVVVEDFNSGLPVIKFSGTTGYFNGKGYTFMTQLKAFLEDYGNKRASFGRAPQNALLFYNLTDEEAYVVHLAPEGFIIKRDVEKPLLYTYEINLIVLREVSKSAVSLVSAEVTALDTNKKDAFSATERATGYTAGTVSAKSKAGVARMSGNLEVK